CTINGPQNTIVMGFQDGLIKVFDINSELFKPLQGHKTTVSSLLTTSDGVVISSSYDGYIIFWLLASLTKLDEWRFDEAIYRIALVPGDDLLIQFKNDIQLFSFTQPLRFFSDTDYEIEQVRLTLPVGSIPTRIVLRSNQNEFALYNPRSTQMINVTQLHPDKMYVIDFVYDSAGEMLYVMTTRQVCSYSCSQQPCYLKNIFEIDTQCLFTKLSCLMWFSHSPLFARKRRAFGIVFVGTSDGKMYLIPGEHNLKYAVEQSLANSILSNYVQLHESSVEWLEVYQSYETYFTRRGVKWLFTVGSDLTAKLYHVSIDGFEIFLRQRLKIQLDAECVGSAMANSHLAVACAARGYLNMHSIVLEYDYTVDITSKDILHEFAPIKCVSGCDALGIFSTVNAVNDIMLWNTRNEIIRKLSCVFQITTANYLNERGDLLLTSNRRLYFIMISDFAPEQILIALSKKKIKVRIDHPLKIRR
ncbi:unnamed protein product, partial [Didymodactylos carnosus]